ncbi:arabinan endo-1,5-alpha-L-arabinosidase [Dictyoglomus turgidum]|uniref:arabinan endo-1,5-alpha-L-arabinosidase n=1 Tax=Dictyoglomus turgidum TaxID=513050 RepID=UPI00235256E2|nr:arabinan endo-1,5-alpha-L-arabinosidase [Dictyoglomus turgidum]
MRVINLGLFIVAISFLMLLVGSYSQGIIYPKEPPKIKLMDASIVNDESKWSINNVHDPSIIKASNGWYYIYSTDVKAYGIPRPGIQIRKSKDLINWQFVGYVFNDDKYVFKGIPPQAFEWSKASTLWAPDVKFMNNKYYLYYSASTFGKNQSYIGLATANNPEGPWKDEGEVIKTRQGDPVNAIDPCLVFDENGEPWLSYGSFWSGIYIIRIDKKTGKPAEKGFGVNIARRKGTVAGAVEGSYIIYNPKFKKYYLFVSYDSLFSDYNVRVGRADKITGPYVDYNGNPLTDLTLPPEEVGTKILGGYKFENDNGWIAPGHNSVLNDGDNWYIVHHARPALNKNWMYLHIRRMLWTNDGWPVVSPERYAGEIIQEVPQELVIGTWERIVLDPYDKVQSQSKRLILQKDGTFVFGDRKGTWEFTSPNNLSLIWRDSNEKENLLVLASWDWENWRPTLVFTGLNSRGIAIWGKKIE